MENNGGRAGVCVVVVVGGGGGLKPFFQFKLNHVPYIRKMHSIYLWVCESLHISQC